MESRDNSIVEDYAPSSYGDIPDGFADMSSSFSVDSLDWRTTNAAMLARQGKDRVGPRTYEVDIPMRGDNQDEFSFLVIGCTGDNSDGQRKVGAMMANHQDAAAVIHLGDAFYTKGLQHVADTKMVSQRLTGPYDAIRFNGKKPTIFCTAGNHDLDLRNAYAKALGLITGSAANPLDNFIALTYFDPRIETIEAKIKYFSQRKISLADPLVGRIFFPHPFYSVVFGRKHQKLFLNTCTIVVDFIRYTEIMKNLLALKQRIESYLPAKLPLSPDDEVKEDDVCSFYGFHQFFAKLIETVEQFVEMNDLAKIPDFDAILSQYEVLLSELGRNQIGWMMTDPLPEAFQNERQLTLVGHHSPKPSTNRATNNDDKYEYFSVDQYKEVVALLGLNPARSHNMYTIIGALYERIGLLPFQILAAHEHCTSVTNSLASNPDDEYPLRLYTIGSGGDKAHCQHRATHLTYPDCTYFRTNESGFAKVTYCESKPFSFVLQTFSLDGLEHRFTESSTKTMTILNQELVKLRGCVFNAYKKYCEALKRIDEENAHARALAKAQQEQALLTQTPKTQLAAAVPVRKPSSVYSWTGFKSAMYSGAKAVKDTLTYATSSAKRFINKQSRDTTFETQLAIIQHIYAYFSQFHLNNIKFEACFNKLVDLVISLAKTTEAHPSTILFIELLNTELGKSFVGLNIYDSLPHSNRNVYK